MSLILTWSENSFIIDAHVTNEATTFKLTDKNFYVPIVTLSTQDNAKLLQQLKSCFKRTINWNKNQSSITIQKQNRYVDYLTGSSIQRINRLLLYHLKMLLVEKVASNIILQEQKKGNIVL